MISAVIRCPASIQFTGAMPSAPIAMVRRPPLGGRMQRCHTTVTAASGATQGMKKATRKVLRQRPEDREASSWAINSVTHRLTTTLTAT